MSVAYESVADEPLMPDRPVSDPAIWLADDLRGSSDWRYGVTPDDLAELDRALNIQFLNNHVTLHGRTGWQDWPDPAKRRHLIRLWLVTPDDRPLPGWYYERYGAGRRGGIYVEGMKEVVTLQPQPNATA